MKPIQKDVKIADTYWFVIKAVLIILIAINSFSSFGSSLNKNLRTNCFEHGDSLRYAEKYEESIEWYEKGLRDCEKTSERYLKYSVRLGISYFLNNQSQKAVEQYQNVLKQTQHNKFNVFRAHALNNLGLVYDNLGQFNASIDYYQRARLIYQKCDLSEMQSLIEMNLGIVYKKMGDYVLALQYLTKAAHSFESSENNDQLAEVYSSIGGIQKNLGNQDKAVAFYSKALILRQNLNDKTGEASILNNLGGVLFDFGDIQKAIVYYEQAKALMLSYGKRNLGIVLHNLGRCYAISGSPEKARKFYLESLRYKMAQLDSNEVTITQVELAKFELAQGNVETSRHYLESLIKFLKTTKNKSVMLDSYEVWKNYYKVKGQLDSAIFYLEKYNVLREQMNSNAYFDELANLQEKFEAKSRNRLIGSLKTDKNQQVQKINSLSKTTESLKKNSMWLLVIFTLVIVVMVLIYFFQKQKVREQNLMSKLYGIELEKRRVSMDLHDAVGSSLKEILESMEMSVQSRELTLKLRSITNHILELSHELHSPDFNQIDFRDFFKDIIFDSFESSTIKLEMSISNVPLINNLSIHAKEHIYRSVQEIITNIKRHAEADHVLVGLYSKENEYYFSIVDNGIGSDTYESDGIGVKNIHERMKLVSGRFIIFSDGNVGTTAMLIIPM